MRFHRYPPTAVRSSRATAHQTPSPPGAAAGSTSRARIHPRDCARSGTTKVNPSRRDEVSLAGPDGKKCFLDFLSGFQVTERRRITTYARQRSHLPEVGTAAA